VEGGHAFGRHHAGFDRERVGRLDEVVIGAGAHAFQDQLWLANTGH